MHERKIASNTIYQFLNRSVAAGTSFLITILLVRALGSTGYGDFTKVTTFVAYFYLIVDFGLNAVYLQHSDSEKETFSSFFTLRLLLALVGVLLLNASAFFLPYNAMLQTGFSPSLRLDIFLYSLTLFSQAVIISCSAIMQKKLRYDLLLIASSVGSFLLLGIVFLMSGQSPSISSVMAAYVTGGFVTAGFCLAFIKKKIQFFLDKAFVLSLLTSGWPLGLMLFFNLLYFRFDILILALLKPTQDVAIYGFAYKFFDFFIAIPLFLSNAVYPFLLESEKNNRTPRRIGRRFFLTYLIPSLLFLGIGWFTAPLLVFVKASFAPSVLILRVLLLSLPVFFLSSMMQWVLIARRQQKYLLLVYGISAIINVALNILFIPEYGYLAAAAITGISEVVVLLLLFLRFAWPKKYE